MKEVGKITRTFRYDLNQSPYDYTVEVINRFKVQRTDSLEKTLILGKIEGRKNRG